MSTVPMLAPDGTPGDVPQGRVSDAVKAGFKVAAELTSPDGKAGLVPLHRVHDAINAGFMLQGAAIKSPAPGDLAADVPSTQEVADRLTKQYVPAMQMVAGFGGAGSAVEAGVQAISQAAETGGGKAAIEAVKAGAKELPNAAIRRIPYVGKVAGDVYDAVRNSKTSPIERDATLDRRNIPEFAGEEIPDAPKNGAPVYRDATKQNVPYAGEEIERPKPPTVPVYRDSTKENAPYAGEEISTPKPNTAPTYRDSTKENVPYAGEEEAAAKLPKGAPRAAILKQAEALKQPVRDIVDSAIPPTGETQAANMQAHAKVEFYLQRGNVEAANKVLDEAAKGVNPNWPPERPMPVPSTNEIREQLPSNVAKRTADSMDDHALQQEMNWNLERHGAAAESEARRQFIAGNSTGMTKAELIRRARIAQPPPEIPADLTDEWTKALEDVKRIQGKK